MKIENFYGNKLLFCTKEEFDNLTIEQMEGVDTAFCYAKLQRYKIEFLYKNNDLSMANLCVNAIFSYLKHNFCGVGDNVKDSVGYFGVHYINSNKMIQLSATNFLTKPFVIEKTEHNTLYKLGEVGNQHWVCEKGNTHNIPKDKSVNVHEYYDVVEKEGYVECTVDFFERGVGKTQACGSGAFCVGMHLFKIHGKEVVVKTENGDKYFVNQNTISVEI